MYGCRMAPSLLLAVCVVSMAAQQRSLLALRVTGTDARITGSVNRLDVPLTRAPSADEGRLAVLIDDVDWSGLFRADGDVLVYSGPAPLPRGDSHLVLYLVSPADEWRQLGAVTVRVGDAATGRRLVPAAVLNNAGQELERHADAADAPPRSTFQDVTVRLGLTTDFRGNGIAARTQTNLLGVTNQAQALRFAQAGATAPLVDLSDYQWTVTAPHLQVALGEQSLALDRHLAPNLRSRGLTVRLTGAPVDVSVSALNGQSVVGFSNFAGVGEPDNRMGVVTMARDLFAAHPGQARVEATLVEGRRRATPGVGQGQIADVLESRGGGVRFLRADPTRRLRFDIGYARNWSTNPADPRLARGNEVVATRARTSKAAYLDADYDLLRDAKTGALRPVSLTGSYRFERVDPFFSSVAASQAVRADLLQNTASLTGSAGPLAAQVSQTWTHDNLGHVASILRTDTGLTSASVTAPLGVLTHSQGPSAWWPLVSYAFNRTRQVGEGIPENGGFASASQVPDQLASVHTVRAAWTSPRWRAGYSVNESYTDNRQPGREQADFASLVQEWTLSRTWSHGLDAGVIVGREGTDNVEARRQGRTGRAGITLNWRPNANHGVGAILNRTSIADGAGTTRLATDMDVQYSYTHTFRSRGVAHPSLQLFTHWSRQASDATDLTAGVFLRRRGWALSSGASVGIF